MAQGKTLYERVGGKFTLEKVHKIFYDKVYAHPWIRLYFAGMPQKRLEDQQTDFMMKVMGGPNNYAGKTPGSAHTHMHITEELFNLRHRLLSESLTEAGVSGLLKTEWLRADGRLKRTVVKKSVGECKRAYRSQPILDFKKPMGC